ncbi:inhibitor of growth protein 1-like [Saccoglossus kowalevskii]|uniref:Inhibitor of growth protein n=1 Tax=Saccoglossus kowalevskii TaxID=10224 RepID=A0ABM0H086_SACKO|nr:PREDICTED: inhibitor of growth protein 1-like [Saccoglossus kowalevskii]
MSKLEMMLSQHNQELQCQTAYVEDYLDCVESLPNDLQRNISQMREIDCQYRGVLNEMDYFYSMYQKKDIDGLAKKRYLIQLQRALVRSQELGDEKLQLCSQMADLVENSTRKLELDFDQLESGNEKGNHVEAKTEHHHERTGKRSRRQRNHDHKEKDKDVSVAAVGSEKKVAKKKKRSKAKEREREASPPEIVIDPNEPTYCLCNQVSYGEMIGCDNDECVIEWFHFNCVGLTSKPKGKWYCPKCTPERKKGHSR